MSDTYIDPATGMRLSAPVVPVVKVEPVNHMASILTQLSAEECEARLVGMSQSELISLVRASFGPPLACFLLTEDETYNAMLKRLACDGLNSKDARDALAAIREWLDRKKGKAVQLVVQDVRITDDMAALQRGRARVRDMQQGMLVIERRKD